MDELDEIIKAGIAEGLDDAAIEDLVTRFRASQTPMPAGATAGMLPQNTAQDPSTDVFERNGLIDGSKRSAELRQQAMDHPLATGAAIAAPGLLRIAGKAAAPLVGPGLTKLGGMLEAPAAGAVVGGAEGLRRGPIEGLKGAAMGATAGTMLGPVISKIGGMLTPKPSPTVARLDKLVEGDWARAAADKAAVQGPQVSGRLAAEFPEPGVATNRLNQLTSMDRTAEAASRGQEQGPGIVSRIRAEFGNPPGATVERLNTLTAADRNAEAATRNAMVSQPQTKPASPISSVAKQAQGPRGSSSKNKPLSMGDMQWALENGISLDDLIAGKYNVTALEAARSSRHVAHYSKAKDAKAAREKTP